MANEDNGKDSWFAISAFEKRVKETDKLVGQSYLEYDSIIMTIRLPDIEHIEIF